jgi:hypothetical protein
MVAGIRGSHSVRCCVCPGAHVGVGELQSSIYLVDVASSVEGHRAPHHDVEGRVFGQRGDWCKDCSLCVPAERGRQLTHSCHADSATSVCHCTLASAACWAQTKGAPSHICVHAVALAVLHLSRV